MPVKSCFDNVIAKTAGSSTHHGDIEAGFILDPIRKKGNSDGIKNRTHGKNATPFPEIPPTPAMVNPYPKFEPLEDADNPQVDRALQQGNRKGKGLDRQPSGPMRTEKKARNSFQPYGSSPRHRPTSHRPRVPESEYGVAGGAATHQSVPTGYLQREF